MLGSRKVLSNRTLVGNTGAAGIVCSITWAGKDPCSRCRAGVVGAGPASGTVWNGTCVGIVDIGIETRDET